MKFIRQLLTDCRNHPLFSWFAGGLLAAMILPVIGPDGPMTIVVSVFIMLILGIGLVMDTLFDIFKL